MKHEPIINYDELFCLTIKDEHKTMQQLVWQELKDIIKNYSNDKELGTYIRKEYGSPKRK